MEEMAGEPGFGLNMLHEVPLDSGDGGQKATDTGVSAEMAWKKTRACDVKSGDPESLHPEGVLCRGAGQQQLRPWQHTSSLDTKYQNNPQWLGR